MAVDRIAELVAKWEPAIANAFLDAVKNIRSEVEVARLQALIEAGDMQGAIEAAHLDATRFRPLDARIEQAFEAGGVDALRGFAPDKSPLGLRINPTFDIHKPTAQSWVRDHSAELIRQITDDQRLLIREAVAPLFSGEDPMITGQTPQKIALDLVGRINKITGNREGGLLGLTSQQAQWARNYEIELGSVSGKVPPDPNALTRALRDKRFDRTVAKAIRDGVPIPADTRRAMVAAYRNKALRLRAETIGNHEALTALHQSQLEAWDQAIARGSVTEDRIRRFWITAGDEKVRPEHRLIPGMNEGGVRLHQTFDTPHGPEMYPPIDPGCRCRVRIRVED